MMSEDLNPTNRDIPGVEFGAGEIELVNGWLTALLVVGGSLIPHMEGADSNTEAVLIEV
jgi:hypothetical protein